MIVIDSREKGVEEKIKTHGIPTTSIMLDDGDLVFEGIGPNRSPVTIAFERKRLSDILGCIHTNRLAEQLRGCSQTYTYTFLIVEYNIRSNHAGNIEEQNSWYKWREVKQGKTPVPYAKLAHFLATTALKGNVPIIYTRDLDQTVAEYVSMYTWWNENGGWESHKSHTRGQVNPNLGQRGKASFLPIDKRLVFRWAAALPGISEVIGLRVANHFKKSRIMANAPLSEWLKIKGVNAAIAKHAMSLIEGDDDMAMATRLKRGRR